MSSIPSKKFPLHLNSIKDFWIKSKGKHWFIIFCSYFILYFVVLYTQLVNKINKLFVLTIVNCPTGRSKTPFIQIQIVVSHISNSEVSFLLRQSLLLEEIVWLRIQIVAFIGSKAVLGNTTFTVACCTNLWVPTF